MSARTKWKGIPATIGETTGAAIGDLILLQLVGVPGARACCEYVITWLRTGRRRWTDRSKSATSACPVMPTSATTARDRERS